MPTENPNPQTQTSPQKINKLTAAGVSILVAITGGLMSRWHGGGFFSAPKIIKALVWSLALAGVSAWAWYLDARTWWLIALVGILVLVWSMVFKNTGHGGGMDDAHSPEEPGDGRDPEKLEYLILWLRKLFHVKHAAWYDRLLMAVIGFFSTLGASIAVGVIYLPAGLVLALGGTLKAAGYILGWKIEPDGKGKGPEDLNEATEYGELFTGIFAYACVSISVIMLGVHYGVFTFSGIF